MHRWKRTMIGAAAAALLLAGCQQQSPNANEGGNADQAGSANNAASTAGEQEAAKPKAQDEPIPADALRVKDAEQLAAAIVEAEPGTTIVLEDGTFTGSGPFLIKGKKGTEKKPITIRAARTGKAIVTDNAAFQIVGSSYIVLQGITFMNDGGNAVVLNGSDHIRVTRNKFALTEKKPGVKWIQITGKGSGYNRIDYNEFGPRKMLGQMISVEGAGTQVSQHDVIEYNYFHDIATQKDNGGETIRLGLSGLSMSDGFATIQYNLFVNCDGDPETVSIKSGRNEVRYNTFRNNKAQVTSRHGHNNSFYGNYFIGSGTKAGVGGIRIYGNDHKVYNNYMEKLTGDAINIDGGDFDGGADGKSYTKDNLASHWRVYRAEVTHNTIVDSTTGIVIGRSYSDAPVDVKIANNLVVNKTGTLYDEVKSTNTVLEGNIGFGGGKLTSGLRTDAEIRGADPKLNAAADGLRRLAAGSPAIDAAKGDYSYVTEDMDGQKRSRPDVGADEYDSAAPVVRGALSPADVGPFAVAKK